MWKFLKNLLKRYPGFLKYGVLFIVIILYDRWYSNKIEKIIFESLIHYCFVLDDNKITSKFETVYEINEGAYFKLQCIVDGNPLSTITWIFTKNNSVLSQEQNKNESVFEKDFASCFDHGEYKVTAENRRGSMVSASTKLAVKCKCFMIYLYLHIVKELYA